MMRTLASILDSRVGVPLGDPLDVEPSVFDGFTFLFLESSRDEIAVSRVEHAILTLDDGRVVERTLTFGTLLKMPSPPIGSSFILRKGNRQLVTTILGVIVNGQESTVFQIDQLEAGSGVEELWVIVDFGPGFPTVGRFGDQYPMGWGAIIPHVSLSLIHI